MIGLVVLVALLVLAWMILQFTGRATALLVSAGHIRVTMTTDRADNVNDGSGVFYRGVNVGQVTTIARSADNEHVLIGAEINNTPPLPDNLVGAIRAQSALGGSAAIYLEPAGPPDGKYLTAGENFPARYEGLSIIPKDIADLAVEIREQHFVEHLDQTVVTIRKQAENAGKVLESVQQIVSDPHIHQDIREAVQSVHSAAEAADRIGAKFEKISDKMETLTDNANGAVTEARGVVKQTGGDVDHLLQKASDDVQKLGVTLDQFQSAATKINEGKGTAGMLINDPKLYESLVDVSKTLNATVKDLQRVIEQWEQEGVPLRLGK
jgi:phospholipid/cholesterol/gamma-HCH transport system substrate-binding protein